MVQAYWIWQHHPDAEMGEKYPLIPERIRGRLAIGRTLLRDSGIPEWERVGAVYQDLGKYVHPTKEELAPVLLHGNVGNRFVFCFDRELFETTHRLTNQTVDAMLYILFLRFPDALQTFLSAELVRDSLEKMEQDLTLGLSTE